MEPKDVDWLIGLLRSPKKKKPLVCARHFKTPETKPGDYFELIKYCCGECGLDYDEFFDTFSWAWDEVKFPECDGVFKIAVRNSLLSTVEVPKGELSNTGLNIFRLAYELSRLCPTGFYVAPKLAIAEFNITQKYLNTILKKIKNLGYIKLISEFSQHKRCNVYLWVDQVPPQAIIDTEEVEQIEEVDEEPIPF